MRVKLKSVKEINVEGLGDGERLALIEILDYIRENGEFFEIDWDDFGFFRIIGSSLLVDPGWIDFKTKEQFPRQVERGEY